MVEIQYDKEAPAWLGQWLTEEEINERFSSVMRANAKMFSMRLRKMVLTFSQFSLRATLDQFHPVWQIKDGVWSCRCDCGCPKGCVHTYLATFLFKLVCQKEGWQLPVAVQPSEMPSKPAQPPSKPAPGVCPQQMTFFRDEPTSGASALAQSAPKKHYSLVCEADFTSNHYGVLMRFFRVEDGYRYPMLMSAVRLLGAELERVEAQKMESTATWPEKDKEFIRWLYPKLLELNFSQLGKRELFMSHKDFWRWMERWSQETGRIVEHNSQKGMETLDIGVPKGLVVRLFDHGTFVRVALLVVMESGKEYHYKDLLQMIADDPSRSVVRNRLSSFNSPVSFETLTRYFGTASADILRGEVCHRLPIMLEGHLELLQPTQCLQIVETNPLDIAIFSHYRDGRFHLNMQMVQKNGTLIDGYLDKDGTYRRLDYVNGKFVLYSFIMNRVQEMKKLLGQFAAETGGQCQNGDYSCKADTTTAAKLRQLWRKLPHEVVKRSDENTRGLLERNSRKAKVELSMREVGKLVEISASCRCGDSFIPFETIRKAAQMNTTIVQNSRGQWLEIDPDSFNEAFKALAENGIDEMQGLLLPDKAVGAMKRLEEMGMLQLEDRSVSFAQRLAKLSVPEAPPLDGTMAAILRSYQRFGTQFLLERSRFGVGAILADDMGLGKTLEVLAMLDAWRRAANGKRFRALVVAPASVVPVWVQQSAMFCKEMKTVAMVGPSFARKKILSGDGYDVLVTHYGLVRSDVGRLSQISFDFVILDEAQAIKNPDAQVSSAVRALEAGCRMALTGTPLENSISDLWSIMDFINPGLLEERDVFLSRYGSSSGKQLVTRRLNMLMIRRTKEMVAPELPPKTEELLTVEMSPEMRKAYNKELVKARLSADSYSTVNILAAITRLRMFCCAPELLEGIQEKVVSPKVEMLMDRLDELLGSGHSVLVFSQFTSMLKLIKAELEKAQISHCMITGEVAVEKRAQIVQEFVEDENPSVFLLSLKAAGTGLTLTKADYVFLFDPWWNPAVENQAIDRTHRIGQDKPVFAYRLIVKDSIEEKVLQIVEAKRQLFAEVIDNVDASGNDSRLTLEELRSLLG